MFIVSYVILSFWMLFYWMFLGRLSTFAADSPSISLIFHLAFKVVVHFSSTFRVIPSIRCSEPHFHFNIQSHHIFRLAFKAVFSIWRLEPCLQFNIQSRIFSLAFRVVVCLQLNIQIHRIFFWFGIQSHIFSLACRATFLVWSLEPHLQFYVQSRVFYLVFRAMFLVRHLESSCLSFVQHLDPSHLHQIGRAHV